MNRSTEARRSVKSDPLKRQSLQGAIAAMEDLNLISRLERRIGCTASLTSVNHLDELITVLKPLAQVMIDGIKWKAEDRAALRAKRGKPDLKKVVDNDE